MIQDGWGDQQTVEEQALADAEAALTASARRILNPWRSDWADMLQEGRIEFWQAYQESNTIPLSIWRAQRRMRAYAFAGQAETGYTGNTGRRGVRREPEQIPVLDAPLGEDGVTVADLIGEATSIEGVEIAYHDGEIQAALDSLTPRQYRYVYARFWLGMDPSGGLHMNPGMRQARAANPDLRRDVLWTGNKTTAGAKQRLIEALSHLADLVEA